MPPGILVWFPIAITILVSGLVVGGMVTINRLIGPRPPRDKVKGEAFECGNPPSGSAWNRFSIRFYLTALLFLIFDVEIVFLYPWAAELRQLGIIGFVEAAIFIAVLVVGLIYAWRRGALDFE
jgi:NADH:ubiquinone oxidoreductase subunit 3 (subunit A)